MANKREKELAAFERLLDVLDTVREQCPWDKKQTMESLRPQTIEETYELSEAILKKDMLDITKELGDLLLHVVFYARIGKELGQFDISDVCNKLCDKLIYRHPHIYGDVKVKDAEEVLGNWEQLKTKEKDGNKTVLSGVPESLPSVIKAYRIQEKARAVGFDWEKKEDVWDKVEEELGELRQALGEGAERAKEEVGDFIFSVINASRLYGIDPDTALEDTCAKFRSRFGYVEEHTIKQGKSLKDMKLSDMDKLWNEAKNLEKKR